MLTTELESCQQQFPGAVRWPGQGRCYGDHLSRTTETVPAATLDEIMSEGRGWMAPSLALFEPSEHAEKAVRTPSWTTTTRPRSDALTLA
jgi:hypothetical protein